MPEPIETFRTEVKHEAGGTGGIFCYCDTLQEALAWAATWPDAKEVHITPAVQRASAGRPVS